MKKVLLIDDERSLNETLTDVIEALGHQVESYFSIGNAVEATDFSLTDIVICDVGLPGENAFDFARWIKDQHHHIGFVLLSAFSEEEIIQEGLNAGADHYLVKPAGLDRLKNVFDSF